MRERGERKRGEGNSEEEQRDRWERITHPSNLSVRFPSCLKEQLLHLNRGHSFSSILLAREEGVHSQPSCSEHTGLESLLDCSGV